MKPAYVHDFFVLGVGDRASAGERIVPLLFGSFLGIDLLLLQVLLCQKLRVASEEDVGSTAGHVGCDGNLAFSASLRHNVRLATGMLRLCIQNVVRNSELLELSGN